MQDRQDQPVVKPFPPFRRTIATLLALYFLYFIGGCVHWMATDDWGEQDREKRQRSQRLERHNQELEQKREQERLESETSR